MQILSDKSPSQFANKLPDTTDVVIIGAGIIGITTAWFLANQGINVLVCEKGRVGGEQSSRNWGWIRQQGRDEAELPIMMDSLKIWENLSAELGKDIGFRREGSLYLCENEADLAQHDRFLAFSPQYGLESKRLTQKQIQTHLHNTQQRWQHAVYTPSDARAEPSLAVPAIAQACAQRGVVIIEDCAVRNISTANGQVDGVFTEHGLVKCSTVLCCGGGWSSVLLYQNGLKLPQLSVKASVARTDKAPLIFNGNAAGSGLSFRRRMDGGYTIAMTDYLEVFPSAQSFRQFGSFLPLLRVAHKKLKFRIGGDWRERFLSATTWTGDEVTPFERNRVLNPVPTQQSLQRMRKVLSDRLPELSKIAIIQSWAGMIDATPDAVPVMDHSEDIKGLFIASGFSGHGFGIGPAAGKIMAGMIQGNTSEHDLSRFRFSRFSDGSQLKLGPSI
ncbi:MAG: glycine/D-amino acid oxidase-like deaminating enzyme [Gammaproteobacteria bacterium]|jgi:glycine/D-amino acid oxidase-like deaminating enzyme